MLTALAGAIDPTQITAVVNTGDDTIMHGLHISPDLDTVTYTLAGMINPDTGWGLAGETWAAMEQLRAYSGNRLGWFNLGDKDLGTHLYRTTRLAEGATLSEVTAEIARRWDVPIRILPMSDSRVETRVLVKAQLDTTEDISFQEYFVGRRHSVEVAGVRFAGVENATAAPGVLEAIDAARVVVICPSNPIVSIQPVLSTGGIGDAVASRREHCVAVSPIIAGRALKGPADRMLAELGHEPSVVGVARMWAPYASVLVIDEADRDLAPGVADAGMQPVVAPTVMSGPDESMALAKVVLGAVER